MEVASKVPKIKLNSGHDMPQLGLGTYLGVGTYAGPGQAKPGELTAAVINAIEAGYRHIDCARIYRNEPEIGAALVAKIGDGTVKRQDLFITSKLWNTDHHPDRVLPAIQKALADLGLDYLDLYLIHWPMAMKPGDNLKPQHADGVAILDTETDLTDTWRKMEELVRLGLTRSIGFSNFNKSQIERILKAATIPPAIHQFEMHPLFQQKQLVEFCVSKGITVTAYSPFGCPAHPKKLADHPKVLEEPKLLEIGRKYGKKANHVILRWLLQQGIATVPKSVTKSRIIDNIDVFDFELSEEDMKEIESLDRGRAGRLNLEIFLKHSKEYPFDDEY